MTQHISAPASLVNTVFTVFVMLKLISAGHPSSKSYYDEICQSLHPDSELRECEEKLYSSLQKFDHFGSGESLADGPFEDSYETLMFLMQHMVRGTPLGMNFREEICQHFWNPEDDYYSSQCRELMKSSMEKLELSYKQLDAAQIRQKRQAAPLRPCPLRNSVDHPVEETEYNFVTTNHIVTDGSLFDDFLNTENAGMQTTSYLHPRTWYRYKTGAPPPVNVPLQGLAERVVAVLFDDAYTGEGSDQNCRDRVQALAQASGLQPGATALDCGHILPKRFGKAA
jgi:hypothetical protein